MNEEGGHKLFLERALANSQTLLKQLPLNMCCLVTVQPFNFSFGISPASVAF